jgi:hypothetical protein
LIHGKVSDNFRDVVDHGSQQFGELVINTWGISIPTENNEKTKKFFELFPSNVTFMISVDKEHGDALRRFGKKLEDVISCCKDQYIKTKRLFKYGIRIANARIDIDNQTYEVQENLEKIDPSGWLSHLFDIDNRGYDRTVPEKFIQVSSVRITAVLFRYTLPKFPKFTLLHCMFAALALPFSHSAD